MPQKRLRRPAPPRKEDTLLDDDFWSDIPEESIVNSIKQAIEEGELSANQIAQLDPHLIPGFEWDDRGFFNREEMAKLTLGPPEEGEVLPPDDIGPGLFGLTEIPKPPEELDALLRGDITPDEYERHIQQQEVPANLPSNTLGPLQTPAGQIPAPRADDQILRMPPDQPQHISPGRPIVQSLPQNAVGNAVPSVLGPQLPNDPLLNLGKRIQELGVLPPTFTGAPTAAPQQFTPPVPFALGYQEEDRPYTSRPDFSKHEAAAKTYPDTKYKLQTAAKVTRQTDKLVQVTEGSVQFVAEVLGVDPESARKAIETGDPAAIGIAILYNTPGVGKGVKGIKAAREARQAVEAANRAKKAQEAATKGAKGSKTHSKKGAGKGGKLGEKSSHPHNHNDPTKKPFPKERPGVTAALTVGAVIVGEAAKEKLQEHSGDFTELELEVVTDAYDILASSQMQTLIEAYEGGYAAEVTINGYLIQYDPGIPGRIAGMTNFGGGGFALSDGAFSSKEELAKTVLQEVFRIRTSSVREEGGLDAVVAATETRSTKAFVKRAYNDFFAE